jgi:hypothetical protein
MAALRAISFRFLAERLSALALPPFKLPSAAQRDSSGILGRSRRGLTCGLLDDVESRLI